MNNLINLLDADTTKEYIETSEPELAVCYDCEDTATQEEPDKESQLEEDSSEDSYDDDSVDEVALKTTSENIVSNAAAEAILDLILHGSTVEIDGIKLNRDIYF